MVDWSGLGRGLASGPPGPFDPTTSVDEVDLSIIGAAANVLSMDLGKVTVPAEPISVAVELADGETPAWFGTIRFDGHGKSSVTHDLASFYEPAKLPPVTSFLVTLTQRANFGSSVEMVGIAFIDETSGNDTLFLNDDSARFDYTTSLSSSAFYPIPTGTPQLTLDFGALTLDARGLPLDPSAVDEVRLVESSDTLSSTGESALLDLTPTHVWRAGVDASAPGPNGSGPIDLSTLTDDEGNAFGGIDGNHTWLLELWDGTLMPAPRYLVVLTPCPLER
ncbi:MAG TPA: hypothetical protein VMI54_07970 [Polyangiaceae bacterium]|nr:hypothetical protein [Polyangiaceae bacterium]